MYPGEEKQTFIKIIEELTAIIEHNPGETIKSALIEGIKRKTQDLKHRSITKPNFTVNINNLGFAEGKEGEEAQEIKTGPKPEILRFGEYIGTLAPSYYDSKTIGEHLEEFLQS